MVAGALLLAGAAFVAYGARLLAAEREPSWIGAVILPGGLLLFGIAVVALLVPGFLPSSLW